MKVTNKKSGFHYLSGFLLIFGAVGLAQAAPQFSQQEIERGAYVAKVGDCIACHAVQGGKPFAGGFPMPLPVGTIYSSNITPDPTYGIGKYSLEDFDRAVRHGVAPGGKYLYPAMPYPSYAKVTPEDMKALYAYFMQGVKPVAQPNKPPTMIWPLTIRWPLAIWNWMYVSEDHVYRPDPKQSAQWNRGAYLTEGLGHCGACHTPRGIGMQEKALSASGANGSLFLSGAKIESWYARNLRGNDVGGLGNWSVADIVQLLKTGRNSSGAAVGSMTEVIHHSSQYWTDADLQAVAIYLKSLPADPNKPKAPQPVAPVPQPDLHSAGSLAYAQYCAVCHQNDGAGAAGVFPAMAGNPTVESRDALNLIHVILAGGKTAEVKGVHPFTMPAFAGVLSDQQVADIATFVRSGWGNSGAAVSASEVAKVRADIAKTH